MNRSDFGTSFFTCLLIQPGTVVTIQEYLPAPDLYSHILTSPKWKAIIHPEEKADLGEESGKRALSLVIFPATGGVGLASKGAVSSVG